MDNFIQIFSDIESTSWYWLFLISFLGGIFASVSPCSLAMLPLIIGYIGGFSKANHIKIFIQLCTFILGTALIFSFIGIICAITGSIFASFMGPYFILIMASLFFVLGLKLVGIIDFEIPVIIKKIPTNSTNSLFIYPFLLGTIFALMGTPCSTPILAGIMAFAAIGKNMWLAVGMLFLFAIGQGLIILIAGLFTSGIKNSVKLAKFSDKLTQFSGLFLIFFAFYMYWKIFSSIF